MYSAEALVFSKIPVNHQVRMEDRVSYLYIEYARIAQEARRALRKYLHEEKVLEEMIKTLIEILTPHLPEIADDRLVSDRGEVEGHRLYA